MGSFSRECIEEKKKDNGNEKKKGWNERPQTREK